MAAPSKARWIRILGGYLVLLAVVTLGAVPAYMAADPGIRPAVVRVAAAIVVGIAVLHLRVALRRRLASQAPSTFEAGLRPATPAPDLDGFYLKLRREIQASLSDGPYFTNVLWPRLERLAALRGRSLGAMPPRRWWRRGPSPRALRDTLARLEEP